MKNSEIDSVFRFISRIKFLLTATNEHGVHSPFVYNFVTKALYQKRNKTFTIAENVMITSISYFSYHKIGIRTESNNLKIRLNSMFDDLEYNTLPFDLIYTNPTGNFLTSIKKENIHNDTMLIVEGIHESKQHTAIWNELKEHELVRVTIDTYYCGLVFFRREQVKEHFKIRI